MSDEDGRIRIEKVTGGVLVTIITGLNKGTWRLTRDAARWAGERLIAMTELPTDIGNAAMAVERMVDGAKAQNLDEVPA
jgi:hypothetical protein